jgi:hypothetical protein
MTNSEKLVAIATFPEPMEANMARSAIESAGIEVFIQGETANSLIPVACRCGPRTKPRHAACSTA